MIEIDIVARRGNVVAVVEVKFRRNLELAVAALQPEAVRRLVRAARQIAGETGLPTRVDLIAIAPWRGLRHLRGVAGTGDHSEG